MVEFLKAKTTQFTNKPIGVISTNTGGAELGNAIARAGANATEMFFQEAVTEQKKLGKDTVAKIRIRQEDGSLDFKELPTTLSDVARETATPLLQKRYADALYVQTSNMMGKLAVDSQSYDEFEQKANDYLSATEDQLAGSNTTSDLIGLYREDSAKLKAQYGIKKYAEDAEKEEKLAIENNLIVISDFMKDAFTFQREGYTDSAEINIQEAKANIELLRGRVPRTTITDLENKIRVGMRYSDILRGIKGMSSVQMQLVEKGLRERNFNNIPKGIQKILEERGVNNKIFRDLTEANIKSLTVELAGNASNQATIENGLKDNLANAGSLKSISNGTAENNGKTRKVFDQVFVGYESAFDWATNPEILKDASKLRALQQANIMPDNLFRMLGNVKNNSNLTSQQVFNLNLVRRQAMSSTTRDGGVRFLNKGLDTDTVNFWSTYDHLVRSMGADQKDQAYRIALKTYATDDQKLIRSNAIQNFFKSDDTASSLIDKKLRELQKEYKWSSSSFPMMKRLAMASYTNTELSMSDIDSQLNDVYQHMYTESKYMYNDDQRSVVKASNFSPERYVASDKFAEWEENANKKIKLAGKNLELGKNVFLLANPTSDASTARYIAVNRDGVALQHGNGNLIEIKTNQSMSDVIQRRKEFNQKLQLLFLKQKEKENPTLSKQSKLPNLFGADIKKQM
tara:strand:- start:3351 stop:5405 length:2055 start_codon:yes stop_codon:yes gene_type:complete